jgi:hypothetical protein
MISCSAITPSSTLLILIFPGHSFVPKTRTIWSYVDLEAGVWTRMKIVVSGTKASLYVNNASQRCLIVNDLKLGETHGQIALWAHSGTDGYFSNLTVRDAANRK